MSMVAAYGQQGGSSPLKVVTEMSVGVRTARSHAENLAGHPLPDRHEMDGKPLELTSGWVVRCTCGWTNELVPTNSADEARAQWVVHVR
jgi:hypothetical protein